MKITITMQNAQERKEALARWKMSKLKNDTSGRSSGSSRQANFQKQKNSSPIICRAESQKSSGRKPLNTMNGIQNIQRSVSPFREPGSAKSTQHKALTLLTDYTKTRLLQEIELIYKEC